MSSNPNDISNQDPSVIAAQAEQDLNSSALKTGGGRQSDSTTESGIDQSATSKFQGASATYGSEASGAGGNRTIPDEEGGGLDRETGKQTKARDFEGVGGPEEKREVAEAVRGGDQDVQGNVRQGGGDDTRY